MPLDLSLPTDRAPPPKDLEVRPKQVKAWVESLPLAQVADSAKKLSVHLTAINRSKLDPDERVQILEAYRPVAGVLLEELEAQYGKAALPLGSKAKEALCLARELAAGLAVGYKVALADRAGKLLAFGSRKQLPLILLRAMEAVAAVLRAGYKSYTPVPEGTWLALHQLYLQAEQERVATEIADPNTKQAVVNVYVECLLLSLTDPYRLSPGEADKVLAQIRSARAPVTLGQVRPGTRSGGHFIVPCDSDKPPKPALSANDDNGGPNWRLLDTNPLVDKIRLRVQAIESGNVSATTRSMVGPDTAPLLQKLVILWGDPPKRAFRRAASEGTVAICVGLKAVAHYAGQEPRFTPEEEQAALRDGITMPLAPLALDEGEQPVPVYEYNVVNRSEGGFKARRDAPTPHAVAVGEVVGVKEPSKRWAVGVVRWVTAFEDGGVEFGVQYLGRGARVVSVQPTITSNVQPRLALLLVDDEDPSAGEALLTAPGTYSVLREFEVEEAGEVAKVRAHALIEKTGRLELFRVSPS